MEPDNDGDVVIVDRDLENEETDTTKRLYNYVGDTPGKPTRKTRRLSRVENSSSSRSLFQSPGTSVKVLNINTIMVP
jgi:hypothetical protein